MTVMNKKFWKDYFSFIKESFYPTKLIIGSDDIITVDMTGATSSTFTTGNFVWSNIAVIPSFSFNPEDCYE